MDDKEVFADSADTRPLNSFPKVVLDTLHALSLTGSLEGCRVLGSGARRAVAYPSDVDGYAIYSAPLAVPAKAAAWAAARFQQCVKDLLALPSSFVGDIKAGVLSDCRVLPTNAYLAAGKRVVNYSQPEAIARISDMHHKGLLDGKEANEAAREIEEAGPHPSPKAWFHLLETLRFEVVRWNLDEIKAGHKKVRGDRTLTLQEAWMQPAIVKIDCVIYNGATARYMDVSQIYELHTSRGQVVNNAKAASLPLQQSIGMDVVRYSLKEKYMKVVKRMLSLATLHKEDRAEAELLAITNTSAGSLYAVQADAGTCAFLVEHQEHYSPEKLETELDAMKSRIAGAQDLLYKFPELEAASTKDIEAALAAKSHKEMLPHIEALADTLAPAINDSAAEQLRHCRLFPPPKWALP